MTIAVLANRPDKDPHIGVVEKTAYGMGDFASCLLYNAAQAFLLFYYTDYLHISAAVVATIMLVSRCFDGFSDILMGHLIERTRSPYGKARAWILRMIIPYMLALTLLFAVPTSWAESWQIVYIFVSYNLAITVVYTAINLPYGAMSTLMTQDSYQRSVLVIYRMVMATGGNTCVYLLALPLVRFFGDDAHAWTLTFLCIGCLGAAVFFCTFFFCHERVASEPAPAAAMRTDQPQPQHSTLKALKGVFTNKYWLMLTIAMITVCTADLTFNTVNIYFCKYFLGDANLVSLFQTSVNVIKVVAMVAILPWLVKRIGKRNCLSIACVSLIAAVLLRLSDPYSQTFFYVAAGLYGLAVGFAYVTLFAMIPDTVEYGEFRDGERHEGYIYAGASFGTKLAAGIGPVIVGFMMDWGGYIDSAAEQSEQAMQAILLTSTVIPAAFMAVAFIAMWPYRLDLEYDGIIKELGRRHAKRNLRHAADVLDGRPSEQ